MAADQTLYSLAVAGGYAAAAAMLVALSLMPAPYGRHRGGDGSIGGGNGGIPAPLAWSLMESPALFLTPLFFSFGRYAGGAAPRAALLLFVAHYAHRVLIYPLRIRSSGRLPLSVLSSALAFNAYNAYIQGRALSEFEARPEDWLASPSFWAAAAIFVLGMAVNIWADSVLIGLRTRGGGGGGGGGDGSSRKRYYSIPKGGLFELVTCPNYLGEILEWVAWAALTRSWAGLLFATLSMANLVPRAVAHHRWYRVKFEASYPASRKALVPFVL